MNHQPSHAALDKVCIGQRIRERNGDIPSACNGCPYAPEKRQQLEDAQKSILRTIPFVIIVGMFFTILLLWVSRNARGEEQLHKRGDRFAVTQKFLAPVKAIAIHEAARAIANNDTNTLSRLVDEEKLGGIPAHCEIRLIDRGASAIAWRCQVLKDGKDLGQLYVYDAFLKPTSRFVRKK